MNLYRVGRIQRLDRQGLSVLNGRIWYRVVAACYAQDPLYYAHTRNRASRFNAGTGTHSMLYLAPDPLTALLEFRALARVPGISRLLMIKPPHSYALFGVSVSLQDVCDLGCSKQRGAVSTSVQEVTGDWRDYLSSRRQVIPSVRSNQLSAPTHRLGEALYSKASRIEGFLAPSAVNPKVCNLVIFPSRVDIDHSAMTITGLSK